MNCYCNSADHSPRSRMKPVLSPSNRCLFLSSTTNPRPRNNLPTCSYPSDHSLQAHNIRISVPHMFRTKYQALELSGQTLSCPPRSGVPDVADYYSGICVSYIQAEEWTVCRRKGRDETARAAIFIRTGQSCQESVLSCYQRCYRRKAMRLDTV